MESEKFLSEIKTAFAISSSCVSYIVSVENSKPMANVFATLMGQA
jgi:hypothetical protein